MQGAENCPCPRFKPSPQLHLKPGMLKNLDELEGEKPTFSVAEQQDKLIES